MLFAPITLLASTAMTGTITTNSQPLFQVYGLAVQAVYTGVTISGSLKLQASVDNTHWADISGTTEALSATGNFVYNINGSFYPFIRAVYTDSGSSGDAAISILIYTKGV